MAEGWRFCANCGTGTDSVTQVGGGLSDDDVAKLIAAPAATETEQVQVSEEPAIQPTQPDSVAFAPEPPAQSTQPEPTAHPSEPAPAAPQPIEPEPMQVNQPVTDGELEPAAAEAPQHTISEPEVSFTATSDVLASDAAEMAPPAVEPAATAPPPPPPDPSLDATDIAAARAEAEAPPRQTARVEPEVEIIEPTSDPFTGATERAELVETGEAIAADTSAEPAVTIPHREEDRPIRSSIPRPIGEEQPAPAEIPSPFEAEPPEAPVAREEPRPRVAVPDREPEPAVELDESDLPPLDSRFRNPGLLGQGVQLLLTVSAALSAAMMVALIVLNNRLDAYATTGESLSRVRSAESMVNTWMRPLLIAAIVITYALLATWCRRALANLRVFNNDVDETPLWMWVMPIVNMWVLFRHLDLSWKGSDYYARGARTWQRGVPDMWTVLFVLLPTLGFVLVLFAWVNGADTFSMAIDSNAFSMIGYFAIAMGLLAGVRSISNIVDRQRTRVEGIR